MTERAVLYCETLPDSEAVYFVTLGFEEVTLKSKMLRYATMETTTH